MGGGGCGVRPQTLNLPVPPKSSLRPGELNKDLAKDVQTWLSNHILVSNNNSNNTNNIYYNHSSTIYPLYTL